ncbi:MAG: DUF2892 domain-containing protein [Candidatus Poseidoniales archaeon]|nr:hypothetical protein [Euryarchaeota archaeon]RJU91163.1 MAG: DUF2892 domain-containing protein [Candidatus Poseidoniales archaeon]
MNLSLNDRIIRVLSGLVMVIVEYASNLNWDFILLVLGLWGILTSAFGFCPFYKLIGHTTCPI